MRARPLHHTRSGPASALLRRVTVLAVLVLACGGGVSQELPGGRELTPHEIETYARRHLLDARALRDEGRIEAAARVAARGLELQPNNAELQRLRAELLESLGRTEEARAHRQLADVLDPPPAPLPSEPLDLPSGGLVVALVPPDEESGGGSRVPQGWPDDPVAESLEQRMHTRLPEARVRFVGRDEPATVTSGRAWLAQTGRRAALSIRVDRAFCARSLKDGEFAVAWLRVSAAAPGHPPVPARQVHTVVNRPPDPEHCREEATARALEDVLAIDEVRAILASPAPAPDVAYSTEAIRGLFPSLGRRIVAEIDAGRQRLRLADLESALAHFRQAAEIDPDDLDTRAFVDDVEDSIALESQLQRVPVSTPDANGHGSDDTPAAAVAREERIEDASLFPPAERRRLEAQLAEEQRRRDELLAALSALSNDDAAPDAAVLAAMRPADIRDPDAAGPRIARSAAPPDALVHAAVLYAPDGGVLSRFYFAGTSPAPIVREDDTTGDGRADRWVVYQSGARWRVLEDRQGNGRPDLIVTFARGGGPIERLEIDTDGDGRPERVFRYADGRLEAEDRDTNGDGRADLFEHFDGNGTLTLREQDVNGDGNVDVRTAYREGRIVRREIVDPDAVTEIR